MSGHTPGPWYHSDDILWACATSLPNSDGKVIAEAFSPIDAVARADARLIAAAPDLLRVVETLVTALRNRNEDFGVIDDPALTEGVEILRRLK